MNAPPRDKDVPPRSTRGRAVRKTVVGSKPITVTVHVGGFERIKQ